MVVHNGIIENYLELKARLAAEGHRFVTQTDTEVIAHLVESHYAAARSRRPCAQALARARSGVYALVLMHARRAATGSSRRAWDRRS